MALTLSHFRFGVNELAESTHGWLAGEDANINLPPAQPFLLRFCTQANATGLNNVDHEFQYRLNGGAWTNITTTSNVVRTGSTTVFTNGQDCTKRLSGTGTFVTNNDGCTHDGTSGGTNNDITANGCSETEIGIQILAASTALGDVIEFRLTRDGGLLLDTYAVVPTLTVAVQVLPIATRQPGETVSNPQAVPAGASGRSFLVLTSLPQTDLDNPSVAFELKMEVQQPDTSWAFNAGVTFIGGPNQGKGGTATQNVGWMQDGTALAGKTVRFTLNNTGVAFDAGLIAVPQ